MIDDALNLDPGMQRLKESARKEAQAAIHPHVHK
jgi:hypothetical protein